MPKFVIKLPDGIETSFFTQDDDIFIGRIPSINDICVNHPSISRQHAHIKLRDEGYTIYDLKSLNGLTLNGKKVTRAVLKHQDVVKLGEVEITVGLEEMTSQESTHEIETFEPTKVESAIPLTDPKIGKTDDS